MEKLGIPVFSRDNVPSFVNARKYRKRVSTKALRMTSPFSVDTGHGVATCEDGYLAIDARGYPYPIARDEFEKIYVEDKDGMFK